MGTATNGFEDICMLSFSEVNNLSGDYVKCKVGVRVSDAFSMSYVYPIATLSSVAVPISHGSNYTFLQHDVVPRLDSEARQNNPLT